MKNKVKKILSLFLVFNFLFFNFVFVRADNGENNYSDILAKSILIKNNASKLKSDSSYKNIGANVTIEKNRIEKSNLQVGSIFTAKDSSLIVYGDLILGANSKIDKDLVVYGNLKAGSNLKVGGDLKVTGDIELGAVCEINGTISGKNIIIGSSLDTKSIIANGNIILGANSKVTNGISAKGYLYAGSLFSLEGKSKIFGDLVIGANSDLKDVVYIYGDLKTGSNTIFEGQKLKITKDFYCGTNCELNGRIYIYGEKSFGSNYEEILKNYSGFFGKIDPLLNYTFSEQKINEIKGKTDYYLSEANKIQKIIDNLKKQEKTNYSEIKIKQNEKYDIYVQLFNYLEPLIEKEDFDINIFSNIKKNYIGKNIENIIIYKPILVEKLKVKLNEYLSKITFEKRKILLEKALNKIDVIIEKLKKKEQTDKMIYKINLILGLKEAIKDILYEMD